MTGVALENAFEVACELGIGEKRASVQSEYCHDIICHIFSPIGEFLTFEIN